MARNHGGSRYRGSYLLNESISGLIAMAVYDGWTAVIDTAPSGDYRVAIVNVEGQRIGLYTHRALKTALRLAMLMAYNAERTLQTPQAPTLPSPELLSTVMETASEVVA